MIHDPTLERTTEGQGPVAEQTAAELAATQLRDGGGAGVPTLDAVLDVFAGSAIELHIEIKTDADGRAIRGWSSGWSTSSPDASCRTQAILTCFVPEALETSASIAPRQRVLASVNQRSAEAMGGLAAALDRFAAIDGCLVAVEKGLLADNLDYLPGAPRPREAGRLGAQRGRPTSPPGWRGRSARSRPTGPIIALEQRRVLCTLITQRLN